MNERIKELMFEAFQSHYGDPITTGAREKAVELVSGWGEKFAELLIKECGQWFNSRLTVEPDYGFEHRIERNRAVVGVMKEYNTHFGVEE